MHFPMLIFHRKYMGILSYSKFVSLAESKIMSQLRYNNIVSCNSCTDV